MERLFERSMLLNQYLEQYGKEKTLFIWSGICNPRSEAILKNCHENVDSITLRIEASDQDDKTEETIVVKSSKTEEVIEPHELCEVLKTISSDNTNLFIDITSLSVRLLAILLSQITVLYDECKKGFPFSKVFCGYTESYSYRESLRIENDDHHYFQFYKDYQPLAPIPGYVSFSAGDNSKNRIWIVLLGFEGNRVNCIVSSELENTEETKAIITVPAIQLEWINHVIEQNIHFIQGTENPHPTVEYMDASSPFPIYNYLCVLKEKRPEAYLAISPLGTKANALGALLYLLNDPYSELIFDNPNERSRDSEEASAKMDVFDITTAIKYNRSNALLYG